MSLKKLFKRIEDKYPWAFLGVLITFALFIIGLYLNYLIFRVGSPDIKFEITNEANVLDVRKPLEDLAISFRGEDIQEKKLNLRILTIRTENIGDVDILQSHYEAEDIWGLHVQNAKIVEARLINSNSEYIQSTLNPHLVGENVVQFKKIIFEKGKFFILELLVLHPKDNSPEIRPLGKIAGIERPEVLKTWLETGKQTLVEELFSGGILVQILRPVIYLIGLFVVFVLVALSGTGISKLVDKRKKESYKNQIDTLLKLKPAAEESKRKIAYDIYLQKGPAWVRGLQRTFENEDRLRAEIKSTTAMKEYAATMAREAQDFPGEDIEDPVYQSVRRVPLIHYMTMNTLLEKGILSTGEGDKVEIDAEFKEAFDDIVNALKHQATEE